MAAESLEDNRWWAFSLDEQKALEEALHYWLTTGFTSSTNATYRILDWMHDELTEEIAQTEGESNATD